MERELNTNDINIILPSLLLFLSSITLTLYRNYNNKILDMKLKSKVYHGKCHCYQVTFTVEAPLHLTVWNCNCSICYMKKNWHFIIPKNNFQLLTGHNSFTEYKFNTKVAKHIFCSTCGVQAYYEPRSNPDGIAVTFACISTDQLVSYEIKNFDGQNWESFIKNSGISIFSKNSS